MRTTSAPNLRIRLHLLLLHRMVAVTVMKSPTSSIFLSPPYVGHVKVCYYDVSIFNVELCHVYLHAHITTIHYFFFIVHDMHRFTFKRFLSPN